jgi:drug/metabolite transporter (DMT)-like permease
VAAFGVLYLGETADWRLITGAVLIFGSGVGLNILPSKSNLAAPIEESGKAMTDS